MAADAIARGERIDPLAPPPPEVKVLEHFGEDKQVLTPTEAADELTSWRERHTAAQQGRASRSWPARPCTGAGRKRSKRSTADRAATTAATAATTTPEQTERAQLAPERQRIAYLKQMEGHEAALAASTTINWSRQSCRSFPRFKTALPHPAKSRTCAKKTLHVFKSWRWPTRCYGSDSKKSRPSTTAGQHEQQQAQINAQAARRRSRRTG